MQPDYGRKSRLRSDENGDLVGRTRVFRVDDQVWLRNYANGPKWLKGTIVNRKGPVTYEIEVRGSLVQRHIDQLSRCIDVEEPYFNGNPISDLSERTRESGNIYVVPSAIVPPSVPAPPISEANVESAVDVHGTPKVLSSPNRNDTPSQSPIPVVPVQEVPTRRSTRTRVQTKFYGVDD